MRAIKLIVILVRKSSKVPRSSGGQTPKFVDLTKTLAMHYHTVVIIECFLSIVGYWCLEFDSRSVSTLYFLQYSPFLGESSRATPLGVWIFLMNFWGMDQWKSTWSYKPHFIKSLRSNFLFHKAHINIIVLITLYLIGVFIFLIKKILCNVRTKRVHEIDFCCK